MGKSGMADRDPCPWRIVDDIGGAFCMGAIGGGIFNAMKGAMNSPSGSKMKGSVMGLASRGPILGGQFAVWGFVFASCDCTLTAIRQKEDPWNSIFSGAITGGILSMRAGPRVMTQSAVVGGVLLSLIEGMGIMLNNWTMGEDPNMIQAPGANDVTAPPTSAGFSLPTSTAPPSSPQSSTIDSGSSYDSTGMSTDTTFSSGSTQQEPESSGASSWFPFGSKS